jgi:drug/metabolite transporter (DMT)-like permease
MKDWGGIAAGLGTVLCFVAMLVAGRLGATTDALTVYDLAGLRMGVAALCATPFLLRSYPWKVDVRAHAVVAFFGGAPFVLLIFGGMVFAPVGHAAVMMNGSLPVFAAFVTWIWVGDRPGRWQWVGIVAITAGVGAVGWEAVAGGIPGQWRGHLLFLAAGLFLPSGLFSAPRLDILLQVVVHGVFGAFLCILCHAYSVKTIGPMRQAAIMSAAPVLALFVAIPTLGEIPSTLNIVGAGIVAMGILATVFLRPREKS